MNSYSSFFLANDWKQDYHYKTTELLMQLTWTQLGVNYQVKMQRKAQQNKEQKMSLDKKFTKRNFYLNKTTDA